MINFADTSFLVNLGESICLVLLSVKLENIDLNLVPKFSSMLFSCLSIALLLSMVIFFL